MSLPLSLSGMKCLSGINGFNWHVPLKSFKSLKETRVYLSDLNDLNGTCQLSTGVSLSKCLNQFKSI